MSSCAETIVELEEDENLSKIPDSIYYNEKISEETFNTLKLTYYKGIEEGEFRYIVREFEGPTLHVKELHQREIALINGSGLHIFQPAYRRSLKVQDKFAKYILLTHRNGTSLKDLVSVDETIKYEILTKLARGQCEMKKAGFFNICFNPEFVYFTDERKVKFIDCFWISEIKKFYEILPLMNLANIEQLAPELRLLKLIRKNYESYMSEIEPFKISLFSFGVLFLTMFKIESSFIFNGDPEELLKKILFSKVFTNKEFKSCLAPSIEFVFDNLSLQKTLFDCLVLDPNCRKSNYQDVYKVLRVCKNEKLKLMKPSLVEGNAEVIEEITNLEYKEACCFFLKALEQIHINCEPDKELILGLSIKDYPPKKGAVAENIINKYFIFKRWISNRIKRDFKTIDKYILDILTKGDHYFNLSLCKSTQVKYKEGFVAFIYAFYKNILIKDAKHTEEIIIAILANKFYKPLYGKIIKQFEAEENILKKDAFLFGLISMTYRKDWYFFFPCTNYELFGQTVLSLESQNKFFNKINNFMMKEKIIDLLIGYLQENAIFSEGESQETANRKKVINIIKEALDHTFISIMPPSLYGLTTYSKKIFVSPFSDLLIPLSKDQKAAMAITIMHEIVHFIRRNECKTYTDIKNNYTPRRSIEDESERENAVLLNEYELNDLRGESGFEMEIKLFGTVLERINESAGKFLFIADLTDLESFRTRLKIKNEKTGQLSTKLGKGCSNSTSFTGLRCGVSLHWK
ncbi:hypothetical protein SteCoe_36837 [Stentor coeruleus]|uniref:Protein kinase domain-containing protein n=1 Tax=Stentor coeruleus TaxID=5963 RepID=A0A1R2APL6_9CILI|nr:hypothetical protein SteCoe_36837 [Stentor coeruleus]